MKTLPLSEAKARLSSLPDAVEGHDEEIVITRNGRAAAICTKPVATAAVTVRASRGAVSRKRGPAPCLFRWRSASA